MYDLKTYFWISLFLYACLSLQTTLWFYIFPFSPSPQIWLSFLVYSALYTNKRSILTLSIIISLLLNPYSLFNTSALFLSLLSYGYIIFYARSTMINSNIKSFFIFSILGFSFIKLLYSLYSANNLNVFHSIFNGHTFFVSVFTGLVSLLFFYIFNQTKLFKKITAQRFKHSDTLTWN